MDTTQTSNIAASQRLEFINEPSNSELNELWTNCFEGEANRDHMNQFVPHKVPEKEALLSFLTNRFFNQMVWLIKHKDTQKIIGFMIHGNFPDGQRNSIGINISKDNTNQGFAKEALKALLDHFKTNGFKEINAYCLDANMGIRKTMEACGMQLESKTGFHHASHEELHYKITFNK